MHKRRYIERCEVLRNHCQLKKLASDDEIERYWPKRGKSAKKDEWIECYAQMVRMAGRADLLFAGSEEAEEQALDALRDEPVPLNLIDGSTVLVYPKGFDALMWFRAKDWFVMWLAARVEVLQDLANENALDKEEFPNPPAILERAHGELAYQLALMAEQACQEGPGLNRRLEAPSRRFLDIDPVDIARIHRAYMEVNAGRLQATVRLVPPRRPGGEVSDRTSWSVFFATMADRLKVDVQLLTSDRSLVSLLAQVKLSQREETPDDAG